MKIINKTIFAQLEKIITFALTTMYSSSFKYAKQKVTPG